MLDTRQSRYPENSLNTDDSDPELVETRGVSPATGIEVDAAEVAAALGLAPMEFQALMRSGRIRTLCERGVGEDVGRYRLSFYYLKRRFRLITDARGNVLNRLG
jgi:hypothetical protein